LNVYDDTYEYKKFVVDNFGDNNEWWNKTNSGNG
jgi:hypothetical protein